MTCYGNRELLYQVWTNIFGNAIKFTDNSGRISASIEETKDNILVIIRDTGIGMTEEVRTHIFEKFYRGDKSRSFEGNGLGLALVKRIVALCQGEITVENKLHQGTSFTVKLANTNMDNLIIKTNFSAQ